METNSNDWKLEGLKAPRPEADTKLTNEKRRR
jgi:hypothetical protein